MLIDRVIVTMDEVEIRYVIPTSPRSERIRFCHLHTDYFGTQILLLPFVADLRAALLGLDFIEIGYFLFFKAEKREGS